MEWIVVNLARGDLEDTRAHKVLKARHGNLPDLSSFPAHNDQTTREMNSL